MLILTLNTSVIVYLIFQPCPLALLTPVTLVYWSLHKDRGSIHVITMLLLLN